MTIHTSTLGAVAGRPTAYPDEHSSLLTLEWLDEDGADVVIITFNRPEQRNPIDKHTIRALRELLGDFAANGSPRVIVLTGAGQAFSAGGDLRGYQQLYRDPVEFRQFIDDFDAVCDALEASSSVVIAMINGVCVAGGLEIALACDIITIADEARIGDGHLGFAQLPGAGGSQRLIRAIGVQHARRWLLTGDLFEASVAVKVGLAAFQAPLVSLREETVALARRMATRTPLGQRKMKELIRIGQRTHLDEGLRQETDLVHEYATQSYDATEGLLAFADRRPPVYEGR
ncbi:enoyl-CoA hydratase/isomerase family protein [Rhodococcus wratislaviensis]|uniref:enoyl-CoA hydratase/isomerase family protein n=1 Tax=Rhodococcus wratislaviensis TaxID=44752 RepID=UPI00076A2062|nr:hypothetical protein AXA44_07755 [Rhodococcus sp. SC4]TQC48642.1 enoyl-CoA hydratase/isomerase family protein [Rhodococcus sp. WS4]